MSKSIFKRWFSAFRLALACCFAAPLAVHAAVVVSFDPTFGTGIPNLGFKGTATLDVPQPCYALGTGFQFVGFASSSCNITVQSATIDFYNSNAGPTSVFFSQHLGPFSPGDFAVFGAYFDPASGELTGIDTFDSPIFSVELFDSYTNPSPNVSFSGDMVLWFESGHFSSSSELIAGTAGLPGAVNGGAFLATCSPASGADNCDHDAISNIASTAFTNDGVTGPAALPEPGSLALVVCALTGLTLSRRCRRVVR